MGDMSVEMMLEMAKAHEKRAKVLWARADRVISSSTKAALMLQADAEQRTANGYVMHVRRLRPQPMKVSA